MLAKIGFSQSYTYFTWRNTKDELAEYIHDLTQTPAAEFFRPNFWPNTPDILHEYAVGKEVGALEIVGDAAQLAAAVQWLVEHPEKARARGRAGRQRIDRERGALQRTLAVIDEVAGFPQP
jgi:hypothetical protein